MAKKKSPVPAHLQPWIDARRKFRLSHALVQMAYELGLNPKKLGKLDNHRQEPWKLPLPDFIVKLYRKRCGKTGRIPYVASKKWLRRSAQRRLAKKANKAMRRRMPDSGPPLSAARRHAADHCSN